MMRHLRILLLLLPVSCAASAEAPVRYVISLADPAQHLVQIAVDLPPGRDSYELQLPVWNALYQIRDFAQYVNWIQAEDSKHQKLPFAQLNKSRWRINGAKNGARIEYQIMLNNPGPYGAELSVHHAFFKVGS